MKLCFLDVLEAADGAVSGAALVTDARTRPLEFRITDRVAVGDLHRVLWGAAFDELLLGELLARPLLDALREEPDVILVRDQRLLALDGSFEQAVLWLGRDPDAAPGGFVVGFRGDSERLRESRSRLAAAAGDRDLLEPFERIAAALDRVSALERAG